MKWLWIFFNQIFADRNLTNMIKWLDYWFDFFFEKNGPKLHLHFECLFTEWLSWKWNWNFICGPFELIYKSCSGTSSFMFAISLTKLEKGIEKGKGRNSVWHVVGFVTYYHINIFLLDGFVNLSNCFTTGFVNRIVNS